MNRLGHLRYYKPERPYGPRRPRRDKTLMINASHPDLLALFRAHCESGWSARTFSSQIIGTHKKYDFLLKSNPEFLAIHRKYTKQYKNSI